MSRLYIIGGGIAGLSAAVHAVDKFGEIYLFEAAGQLGGRCRSYHDAQIGREIDNGNHLVLGANGAFFDFLRLIGSESSMAALPNHYSLFSLESEAKTLLRSPFYLPNASLKSCFGLLRLMCATDRRRSVSEYMSALPSKTRQWITLLCTSIMNTPPEQASASLFARTLRRIIFSKNGAAPYQPKLNWQQSLIDPACQYVKGRDVSVRMKQRVTKLEMSGSRISAIHGQEAIELAPDDQVICALPGFEAQKLLPDLAVPTEYAPILNVHFNYDIGRATAIYGVLNGTTEWVFIKEGMISTTTSAAEKHIDQSAEVLAACIWEEVKSVLQLASDTPLPAYRVLKEKRATFRATPSQVEHRLAPRTPYQNLFLAGDDTDTGLPATIEGAIVSGKKAAQLACS